MKKLKNFLVENFGKSIEETCDQEVKIDAKYEAEAIKNKLKETLEKRWEVSESESYEEKFNRMVDEAVRIIKDSWNTGISQYRVRTSDVELEAFAAFSITDELFIFSDSCCINPDTDRICLYGDFKFSSTEEKERFMSKLMSKLPSGTVVKNIHDDNREVYSFYLHIPME